MCRRPSSKTSLPYDPIYASSNHPMVHLQPTLNTRKMLLTGPMSLGPNVSHSFPDVSALIISMFPYHGLRSNLPNMNDLQPLLHLVRHILNILLIVSGE